MGTASQGQRAQTSRRSFSARARQAAFLQAHGHSRKETAEILGVAPETISVWKRHPQWQLEMERWRKLAERPLEAKQLHLQLESAEAAIEALEQLRLIMGSATKRVRPGRSEPWRRRPLRGHLAPARGFGLVRRLNRVTLTSR
jgi:transposase-like protein